MNGDDHWFRSRPVQLNWMGWTTDTLRLQQAGWSMSAEQDISRMEMMLSLRHPHSASYGISSRVDWRYMEDMRHDGFAPMHLGADIRFARNIGPDFNRKLHV